MGEALALLSSFTFSLSIIYLKIGQAQRPKENGVFMTSLVNLGMYLALAVVLFALGMLPPLTLGAVAFFIIAGFTNTLVGRWAWLQSVHLIGPSRGTALKVTAPVFSGWLAYVFLAQPLTVPMLLGILVTIGGVIVMSQESGSRSSGAGVPPDGLSPATPRSWRDRFPILTDRVLLQGVVLGLLSAFAYGSGSVLRKAGLETAPSPVAGALIGSVVAVGTVLLSDAAGGNLGRRWADNVRNVPMPYVFAGICAGVAQLCSFGSLIYTTVARSSTLASTQPMATVLLSYVFFRSLDTFSKRSLIGMAAITGGVILVISLG